MSNKNKPVPSIYPKNWDKLSDKERSMYNYYVGKMKSGSLSSTEKMDYDAIAAKLNLGSNSNKESVTYGNSQMRGEMTQEELDAFYKEAEANGGEVFAPEDLNKGLGSTVSAGGVKKVTGNSNSSNKSNSSSKSTKRNTPNIQKVQTKGMEDLVGTGFYDPFTGEMITAKGKGSGTAKSSGTNNSNQGISTSTTSAASSEGGGIYDPLKKANDFNSILGGAIELGGIGMNLAHLMNDKKIKGPKDIPGLAGTAMRIYAPDVYTPAVNDINRNSVRQTTLALESGIPGVVLGVDANENNAILKAAELQGKLDADAINKTAGINNQNSMRLALANNANDRYNAQQRYKAKMDKFKILNADENALFQGFKNLGAIIMNAKYQNALNDVKSEMYSDGQNMQFINSNT